jgi:hypothetical protein
MPLHKHWLIYYAPDVDPAVGKFKTDCRLTIGQMYDHGQAIARRFPTASIFIIFREDGKGKPLVPVAGPFKCP